MATLRSLADTLGRTVIEVLAAPEGLDVTVRRVVVNDPGEPFDIEPGDIVLGVGASRGREAGRLLSTLAGTGAAALVVKSTDQPDRGLIADAESGSVALLAVPRIAAWAQVVQLLGSTLSRGDFGAGDERLAGVQGGDLFAIANVISELVDAPITIEDAQSRVVAFSGRQDEADPARVATVLGRAVPAPWLRRLQEQGVYQRLSRERDPIYVDNIGPDVMPRVAVAVRAGDEVLASVWAAVPGPMSPERQQALADAAGFVALHLLRHRLTSDVRHGLERELVSTVLEGGGLASDAAGRLGIAAAQGFRVVVVGLDKPSAEDDELIMARCRDVLAMQVSASHRGARMVVSGSVVYGLLPLSTTDRRQSLAVIREQLEQFASRAPAMLKSAVLVGVGSHAQSVDEIAPSRATADEVLRVLRHEPSRGPVADMEHMRSVALLLRFAQMCSTDPLATAGPLPVLLQQDAKRSTDYVPTLRAYLDAFGDVEAAAIALGVHANTIRYRLRRMQSLVGIDLRDPTERLALMLQLQVLDRG
jgi:hypothetical protein